MTKHVNVENCLKLAKFIEAGSWEWDIAWTQNCFFGQYRKMTRGRASSGDLFEFLGIQGDRTQGVTLTQPPGYYLEEEKYPRDAAVRVLRRLAETGEVQW